MGFLCQQALSKIISRVNNSVVFKGMIRGFWDLAGQLKPRDSSEFAKSSVV